MSSVIKPVGPEESGVYWKRRALVGGIALLVLFLLWLLLWPKGGGEPEPAAAPASPSAAPSPSAVVPASPAASASPSATGTGAPCADADIEVAVTSAQQSYPAGVDPELTLSITNSGTVSCQRDVGSAANEIIVSSGGVRVWSSDDCSGASQPDVISLKPNEPATVTVEWPRTSSEPGCATEGTPVTAGAYDAVGRNGKVQSGKAQFTLQ